MTMAQACPPPFAIKCCSGGCALTKPPPVRDWDWQSFAILPNFTRGRSRWTTRLWAACARASGCPPECPASGFAQPEAIREMYLQLLVKRPGIKEDLVADDQAVFERHQGCRAADPDRWDKLHIVSQHRLLLGTEFRVYFNAIDEG